MDKTTSMIIDRLMHSALSHYQIGKDTGISSQTISNYRRGRTIPKGPNLLILAKYFGLDQCVEVHETKESTEQYTCLLCAEKKREIERLKSEIKTLRGTIENLKREVKIQDKYIKLMEQHGLRNKEE